MIIRLGDKQIMNSGFRYVAIAVFMFFAAASNHSLFAQKEFNNWFFGIKGMTWNTTQGANFPTPITSPSSQMQAASSKGTATVSDHQGNLLFYSDGETIWNSTSGVIYAGLNGKNTAVQSCIAVNHPGDPRQYLIFTITGIADNKLSYTQLDLRNNSVSNINTPLTGAKGVLCGSLTAVRHDNGVDYWIIAVGKGNGANSALNVWKVTPAGVQTAAVASYTLSRNTPNNKDGGCIRFSPDGRHFAWGEGVDFHFLHFGKFNPATGTFSDIKSKDFGNNTHIFGVEFSPSGEIVFVLNAANPSTLYAYKIADLLADPSTASPRTFSDGGNYGALQRGPDGRIYSPLGGGTNMYVIDNTDNFNGITASQAISINKSGNIRSGMPQFFTLPDRLTSYGDAPDSYGDAAHYLTDKLYLGAKWDTSKVQHEAIPSVEANTAENDNALPDNITPANGYTNLNHGQFKFNINGKDLEVTFNATNSSTANANLIGWIDFNHDGVFQSSEASTPINNVSGTGDRTLIWTNADTKMRNGITYLRLRLTTNNINTSATGGLYDDGEVEDYRLNFNLLTVEKTVSPAVAKIGDEVEYTITVTNNSPVNLDISKVFDPYATNYSTHVTGSGGTATTITVNGVNNTPVVQWTTAATINANGGTGTYKFKVKLTDAPQLHNAGDSISNVAYVILNNDTISSTGNNCDLSIIEVNVFDAVNDTVTTTVNTPLNIKVLDNDVTDGCNSGTLTVDLSTQTVAKHGSATVNVSKEIEYTPNPNWYGIDSLRYRLGCTANNREDSAMVYIAVLKPFAQQYTACPGASVTLGIAPVTNVTGVTYTWYNSSTGTTSVNTGLTYAVNKDVSALQQYWLEVAWNGITFERYRFDLLLSANCGTTTPTGCAATGTILFKEDFGGNSTSDNVVSTTAYPNCEYTFCNGGTHASVETCVRQDNYYAISKRSFNFGNDATGIWHNNIADHTFPSDVSKGYFMFINATADKDTIFKKKVDNLCSGVDLTLSAWLVSAVKEKKTWTDITRVLFQIEDVTTGNVIAQYYTGEIPDADPTWKQYGFTFQLPAGVTSIVCKLVNDGTGASGADFMVDDIEIRFCAPEVTAQVNGKLADTICAGGNVVLSINGNQYNDSNGTFVSSGSGNHLVGYWMSSSTGDINNPGDWTEISASRVTGTVNNQTLSVPPYSATTPLAGDTVYYRFVVANSQNVNSNNCRAMTNVLQLIVRKPISAYPNIRIQLCNKLDSTLYLSSYLDSIYLKTITWTKLGASADIQDATTGKLFTKQLDLGLHSYKYEVVNDCGTGVGTAYIKVVSGSKGYGFPPDTVVVCRQIASAAYLQLNQMMGLEAGGVWGYDATLTPLNAYVTVYGSSSVYRGAHFFDAIKAWTDNKGTLTNWKGDATARKFEFTYTPAAGTCFQSTPRKMVIVVTDRY